MELVIKRLEIQSSDVNELQPCQLAYIKDKGCFAYKDSCCKISYFDASKEFKNALEENDKNIIKRNMHGRI